MLKRRISKTLGLLLAVQFALVSAAGCGGKESKPTEQEGKDQATEAPDKPEKEDEDKGQVSDKNIPKLTEDPLTIVLWDHATEANRKGLEEGAVQRFMKDYPNIKVEQTHYQNDNYKQQLVVAMSSGQAPDMYIHWGGGPMVEYYKSGFVNDMTDYFKNYDHPPYLEAAVAQSSYDGKVLAIPYAGLSGCVIYYNKTIFEECGIEIPQTIEELEKAADTLLEHNYVPFSLANANKWTGSMYYMYLVARRSGNDEFNAAYTQENGGSFTSDAFIYAGEKIQDWVKKGYFPDGVNSLNTDDGQDRQLLYDNTCAMMLHGTWQTGNIANDSPEWYKEHVGVFRFPEDSEAKAKGVDQKVEVGTAIGNGFSFNCWNEDGTPDQTKLDACYVLATQYYCDDIYNQEQIDAQRIPAVEGYNDQLTDPNMKAVADIFAEATNVQLWYDQYLPASVTEIHKNAMSDLFGLTKTPEQIGEDQDAAMKAAIADQN